MRQQGGKDKPSGELDRAQGTYKRLRERSVGAGGSRGEGTRADEREGAVPAEAGQPNEHSATPAAERSTVRAQLHGPASAAAQPVLHLHLLSGVATSPDFMEECREELHRRYVLQGWQVQSQLLFPYGDWSTGLLRQLREMRRDLMLRSPLRVRRSIGGRRAAEAIAASGPAGAHLLVGHSGGGVAAVHAAQLLAETAGLAAAPLRIVQIGSPKCPVPEELRPAVLYLGAADASGRSKDPITLIGSWHGWVRGSWGVPLLRPARCAPGVIQRLSLEGGHADYFRSHLPYVDAAGVSNLAKVIGAVGSFFENGLYRP